MTVSIEQLRHKLSPRFPDLEQVGDSVVRFERKAGNRPFAVCYVDVSAQIPSTREALNAYQDRVVARHYFEGSKSLQWSNYLFFVVDTQPSQQMKAVVERDRKYARKFILTESELHTALTPPSFQVSDAAVKSDILTTWTTLLAAANLDSAILNDESLPRRLELIEASFGQGAMPVPSSSSSPRQAKQPFLRNIELRTFREHPMWCRSFDLGAVTLICGANGTGKTSLMEAIELVYCGRTKRNPKASDAYSLIATYADGTVETANHRRAASLFRNRNLAWYGQAEVKRDTLCLSFSRFNFLNTDAAVGLAEGKDDFADDLSKLLVGPETSKWWKEIGRTADKLADKIKELDAIRNQVQLEQASVARRLAASGEMKQESGAVLKKLDELLLRLPWTRQEGDASDSVKQLVESLAEFDTLVTQAIAFDWAGAPVTLAKLREFLEKSNSRSTTCEGLIKKLDESRASERRVGQELSRIEHQLAELTELSKCFAAGIPQRLAEVDRLTSLITKHQQVFAGFNEAQMQPHLFQAAKLTVAEFSKTTSEKLLAAKRDLTDAKRRYSEFSALRNESVNLAQRLREVASQIVEKASEPDTCPLCHTQFPAGELATHIQAGVDQKLEEKAVTLLAAIRQQEANVGEATTSQSAAQWAELACQRLGQLVSISIAQLLKIVSDGQEECVTLIQTHLQLSDELAEHQKAGLTSERYRQLLASVSATFESPTAEQVQGECTRLGAERDLKVVERNGYKTAVQQSLHAAEELLAIAPSNAVTVESALARLKERVVATQGLLDTVQAYVARFPWSADQPLSDLAIAIGSIRKLAGDFQVTLSKEQNAVTVLAEDTKRREQLEKQLAGLLPRIDRFTEAQGVLSKIQNDYSLNGAMEEALRQNRAAIEAIFSRIHSPAEFSGLGDSLTTLVRKNGGVNATLQQISTGQRAAFALSLFLAQNAQLRSAPPLVLIDDPIAHVDDLNCLSFLDYLREVVVAGDRQVVFATANDKLAMLFERKFDFLGNEEFRRYDLSR
ncbi:MAG TPA: AAA family ATPase [Pirellulaceae bacterium]|nr:AAA family ATPase [Pirellulaceae bacterium]